MRPYIIFVVVMQLVLSLTTFAQESYPTPEYERLTVYNDLLYRRDYRQVIGEVNVFDAPDGNIITTRPAGTYFVSVNQYQDGWAEINAGQWIRSNQLVSAPVSYLGGVILNGIPEYPLGILHENVYLRSQPATETYDEARLIEEYELVYVFDEIEIDGTVWVLVEENGWIRRSSVRLIKPVARHADIASERWVGVDVTEQISITYDGDIPVFATLVSTGLEESPTNTGVFSTYARFSPRDMSRGDETQPWFYHMEDVPYTFYFNDNQALHGAYWHNQFGTPQSHGCVNMSLTDAYWQYSFLSETLDVADPEAIWPMVYVYLS